MTPTNLITGAAGFIGSNLARTLLDQGHRVIGIDNFVTGSRENITHLTKHPNFTFIQQDITKPINLKSEIRNLKSVYHLACPTGVPNLTKLAEEMLLSCSVGTMNVLNLARKNKAHVVFTSSSEAYGNPKESPQKESYTGNVDPRGIRSPYEEGKRFSESLCMMYQRKYGIDVRIVRVFNTYGPNMSMKDQRVIPAFVRQIMNDEPLTVHGDGSQIRTFCYVDDLVSALTTVMEKGKAGMVYNAGGDEQVSIRELAELVLKIANSKPHFVPTYVGTSSGKQSTVNSRKQTSTSKNSSRLPITDYRLLTTSVARPKHDHDSRLPDLTKIKRLGWRQKVSLQKGLLKTLKWYNTAS